MDWDIMFKQLEVDRKAQKAALGVTRQGWVATLRQQNVKTLTAQYSGYGDSGNIEDIQLELGVSLAADIEEQLRDFLWSVAYNEHPGFENNDGGEGTLTWDITADSLTIEHGEHVMQTDWTTLEDL